MQRAMGDVLNSENEGTVTLVLRASGCLHFAASTAAPNVAQPDSRPPSSLRGSMSGSRLEPPHTNDGLDCESLAHHQTHPCAECIVLNDSFNDELCCERGGW